MFLKLIVISATGSDSIFVSGILHLHTDPPTYSYHYYYHHCRHSNGSHWQQNWRALFLLTFFYLLTLMIFQTNEDTWHNPLAPPSYQDENVERCPFFQRTGACRFGDRFASLLLAINFKRSYETRMHSSRMRGDRSSGCWGVSIQAPPRTETPTLVQRPPL